MRFIMGLVGFESLKGHSASWQVILLGPPRAWAIAFIWRSDPAQSNSVRFIVPSCSESGGSRYARLAIRSSARKATMRAAQRF